MTTRVQVLLDEADRERYRRLAKRRGVSLSAWMGQAARERAAAEEATKGELRTRADLERFFASCDARESGREPDWEEHLAVIEGSRRSAAP